MPPPMPRRRSRRLREVRRPRPVQRPRPLRREGDDLRREVGGQREVALAVDPPSATLASARGQIAELRELLRLEMDAHRRMTAEAVLERIESALVLLHRSQDGTAFGQRRDA